MNIRKKAEGNTQSNFSRYFTRANCRQKKLRTSFRGERFGV